MPATELPSPMTGIEGGAYEFKVIAYFLLLMILGAIPPVVLPNTNIRKLVPQNKKKLDKEQDQENPFKTDDLIVYCSNNEITCRLLVSIKMNISFTKRGKDIREVLRAAYRDTQNKVFDSRYDRVVLVAEVLDGHKNGALSIVRRAKSAKSYSQAFPENSLTRDERGALDTIKAALSREKEDITDNEIYDFVRCFDVILMDIRDYLDMDGYSMSLSNILSLVEENKKDNVNSIEVWRNTLSFVSTLDNLSIIVEKDNLPSMVSGYYERVLKNNYEGGGAIEEVGSNSSEDVDISMLLLGRIESRSEGDLELFDKLRSVTNE